MKFWNIVGAIYFSLFLAICMGCLYLATLAQGGW